MERHVGMAGSAPRTVVIVGAGFAGTTVATSLLRIPHAEPLRIVLLERAQIGRGVAYAQRPYPYLLNVPAGRMSANPDDPTEFLAFARRRQQGATAEDFLPRELYGDYLESSLVHAEAAAPAHVELRRVYGTATEIERFHRTPVVQVHLADGRKLSADAVVLALGNPPPAALPGDESLRGWSRYSADPWQSPADVRAGEAVCVVGTGLTAVDAVVAASHAAGGAAEFHAISRHGLLPPSQTHFQPLHDRCDAQLLLRSASVSVTCLVRTMRRLSEECQLRGGDWREVVTFVRELAPALWQRLSVPERRRFLRHARCYWDIHRHRLPAVVADTLSALRRSGQLHLHAGRLVRVERSGRRIRITWRPRGHHSPRVLLVDRLINCTGPDYDIRRTRERLLRTLVAHGVASPDPLGLGLLTDSRGALVDASGRAARNLYYVGPMLRATYWETTAVAELREHAVKLAMHLAQAAEQPHTLPAPSRQAHAAAPPG